MISQESQQKAIEELARQEVTRWAAQGFRPTKPQLDLIMASFIQFYQLGWQLALDDSASLSTDQVVAIQGHVDQLLARWGSVTEVEAENEKLRRLVRWYLTAFMRRPTMPELLTMGEIDDARTAAMGR